MNTQVDAFIDALEIEQQQIANTIRNILLTKVDGIEEKFSFKTPFYHYFGMFCYISKVKEGIELCFCRGKDLALAFPQLSMKNRKLIASVTITNSKEIAAFEIVQIIQEAAALQIEMYATKRRKK